ncbi:MAG: hypothetical protein GC149_16690 [Gammaproteobacteria bacterium]|nr:hypothetical protein [Gammaproteobacteria bacterium]
MLKNIMFRIFHWIFHSRLLFVLTLLVIFYGLFLIPNNGQSSRTWSEINNTGHIGAFLIIWLYLFNLFPRFTRLSTTQLFVVVIGSTLVAAELIEIVQGWIGRDDELQDVWDSGVGAMLAIAFCSIQVRSLSLWQRAAWRTLALSGLVAVPWSIWSNLADEAFLHRQFPVLTDFSTPFELTRWDRNAAAIQIRKNPGTGQKSLAIEFRPAEYSTVTLQYFYPDWQGYKELILDVTNPESSDLPVVLRAHDILHKRHHYEMNDRFNRRLVIKPGHQIISVALEEIRKAPATRQMDMRHMEDLSIFTVQARSNRHLYINKIYLE